MKSPSALVIERLCRRFPTVPESTIAAEVASVEATFGEARIRDFIPLLVEREVRDLLAHRVEHGASASIAV